MSGSGTPAPKHQVAPTWAASSSSNVVGYNVYRGTTSGGPYSSIDTSNPSTTYTDATVQAGQVYYYVVTAIDSSGGESAYSNQVSAQIPSP
jgi:fibronectin type 3 domain-containing protein